MKTRIRKIASIPGRVYRLLAKWVLLFARYLLHYGSTKRLAGRSMLSPAGLARFTKDACPVCDSQDTAVFFSFPLGFPEGQNHALLYFDLANEDIEELQSHRRQLDDLMGFFVCVPWRYCSTCSNAFLGVELTEEQLGLYYSSIYRRSRAFHPNRRRTKELHGEYLSGLLVPGSSILEVGAAEGLTAGYLVGKGFDVTASELSADHRAKLAAITGLSVVDDVSKIESGTMDCVYLHHVLEHVVHPAAFVEGLVRVLKPGGLLLVQVPELDTQVAAYARYLKRSPLNLVNAFRLDITPWPTPSGYPWLEALLNDHVVAYSSEGLRYLLQEQGLLVDRILLSKPEDITVDTDRYAWPVDTKTGNTPNSLTALARRPAPPEMKGEA